MDESWRIPIKMSATIPNVPRRKSTEESYGKTFLGEAKTLDPEDFNDIFGGPPRSVLAGQFSGGDFTWSNFFYEDIFLNPERLNPAWSGRRLPELRIPANGGGGRRSEEFYSDVFGMDLEEMWRSRSRSKSKTNSKSMSNSSSVLSSEDFGPFRLPVSDDDDAFFSVLASKLRPKHVPSKWNTSTVMHEVRQRQQGVPNFSYSRPSSVEKHFFENEQNESFKSTYFGFSQQVSSPETISLGPNSYGSFKVSLEDLELNSPSSVESSIPQEQEAKVSKTRDKFLQEEEEENDDDEDEDEDDDVDDDDDDDEVMSSYVIEINSDHKEGTVDAQGLDEVIAWAKEKFQSHSSVEDWSMKQQHEKEVSAEVAERPVVLHFPDGQIDGCGSLHFRQKEMALLDEDVRLWSSGKEKNIQLLLSTLHDILSPSSGWYPVPLTNLNESSNVKKAYQKARLCLHPDKLQQRGANFPQKYVADKAFPILQDAWSAFISQEVIISARG